jgi:hypothetical protein
LCAKCNQFYISGLIDPSTSNEHKKVTRFVHNLVGQNAVSSSLKSMTSASQVSIINPVVSGVNIAVSNPESKVMIGKMDLGAAH